MPSILPWKDYVNENIFATTLALGDESSHLLWNAGGGLKPKKGGKQATILVLSPVPSPRFISGFRIVCHGM
jgi:hypothetical protein